MLLTNDTSSQRLVYMVKPVLEIQLLTQNLKPLKATQMIIQPFLGDNGSYYYVKVQTPAKKHQWIFVKIYEPPQLTNVSPVQLKGVKTVNESDTLTTF